MQDAEASGKKPRYSLFGVYNRIPPCDKSR